MPSTRIVLADDHALVRAGLRRVLQAEDGWEVVAEAGTTPDAVRLAEEHRPDVLVLDLVMPGGSALEAISAIRAASPATRVVVLTMQDDPEFARHALREGATAYVLKEAADEELTAAIQAAVHGTTYLNPRLGAQLAAQPSAEERDEAELSPREAQVLRLIAHGHTNAEVATRLRLSVRTVETHRARMQRKLHCSRRRDLVRYALEHGLSR